MKKLLRIAAALSFGSFLSGGLIVVGTAVSSLKSYGSYSEAVPVAVIGLVLIGAAFFAGSVLWLLVEKFCPQKNDK
jgi:hypothetical protein